MSYWACRRQVPAGASPLGNRSVNSRTLPPRSTNQSGTPSWAHLQRGVLLEGGGQQRGAGRLNVIVAAGRRSG